MSLDTLRAALALIPASDLEAPEYLIVYLSPREGAEGFAISGSGDLCEMVTAVLAEIRQGDDSSRKH